MFALVKTLEDRIRLWRGDHFRGGRKMGCLCFLFGLKGLGAVGVCEDWGKSFTWGVYENHFGGLGVGGVCWVSGFGGLS